MDVRRLTDRRRGAAAAATLIALALIGCQQEEKRVREPTPLDLTTVGAIAGQVRFEGPVPAQATLNLSATADCAAQHSGPVLAGDILVADGKLQNALVYVQSGLGERVFGVPETEVVIDQQGCVFVPRVAAAQAGQPVRFLNSDPLAHNVRAEPKKARGWNFSLSRKGAARTINVDTPEPVIELKCDIHPWMKAYAGAFSHDYFRVTAKDGMYELKDLPPGDYEIEAWHERAEKGKGKVMKVTLKEKETKDLPFDLKFMD